MSDQNPLQGKYFYDPYKGTEGRIGEYLGAGFYLESRHEGSETNGRRIFNLANLGLRSRFFETEQQRDAWVAEKVRDHYDMVETIRSMRGDDET